MHALTLHPNILVYNSLFPALQIVLELGALCQRTVQYTVPPAAVCMALLSTLFRRRGMRPARLMAQERL
jgi:hypothetical protein